MNITKKIILTLAVVGGLAIGSQNVSGASFKYTDMITYSGGQNGGPMNPGHTVVNGEFNILPGGSGGDVTTVQTQGSADYFDDGVTYTDVDGFVPGSETVTQPSFVSFYFRDNNDQPNDEVVTIALENGSFNSGTVTLNNRSITFVQIGGTVDIFTQIDGDGKLSFTVTRNDGVFYLDYARLDVNTTNVPDGGTTSILLGASFLALAGLRSRLQR
ncbi:MAG: VPDSG-CTERM sorting domain-containing protein [Verrucomicrobiales bacterium]